MSKPAAAPEPEAPWPELVVDGSGRLLVANAAASGLIDGETFDVPDAVEDRRLADGRRYRVQAGPAAADGRRRVTLVPIDDLLGRAERLAERLEVVQAFGQIGFWERDIRSLEGRWDHHMHRIFGLPESDSTPTVQDALSRIAPEDVDSYLRLFEASLHEPGSYAHRHRVLHNDGSQRQVQVQWIVRDGADGRPERVDGVIRDESEAFALARANQHALERFRTAIELARVGLFEIDLKTDLVTHNRPGLEFFGIDPDSVPAEGLPRARMQSLVHPDDLPALNEATRQAIASGVPVDVETRFRRGEVWWHLLTRRVVLRDAAGRPTKVIGVGLDVTAEREATAKSQEILRRFELVTRAAGVGYWVRDLASGRVEWSAELLRLHGLPPGEPPSFAHWIGKCVLPEDRESARQALVQWRLDGYPRRQLRYRVRRPDGKVADLVAHASAEGEAPNLLLFGVVIDATEQQQAEAALRRAGERNALVADALTIGTWEFDPVSGQTIWDEPMWRLRGLTPRERALDGPERLAIVHPDDLPATMAVQRRMLETREPTDFEFRVLWPDGSVHWIASRSVDIGAASGGPPRRIGVNWDVTAAREAAIAKEEKLAAQREVQAKAQFLARMSHELRTPLNAVIGFTDLMIASTPKSRSVQDRRRLDHISAAGRHLLALIDDVLELSSLEGHEVAIALQPVSLAEAVQGVRPLLQSLFEREGVSLRLSGLEGRVVLADPTRLRQVLLNLLSNGAKYNWPGGNVAVDAGSSADGDGGVLMSVTDSGRGMTAEQLEHLFEPFNRLGAERSGIEGTGIGLAIVKALVERMGGTIAVQSSPGEGSRFEIRLRDGRGVLPPALPEARPRDLALAASVAHAGLRAGPQSVLYIEDNPVNAMIVGELIQRRGDLQLHHAEDGVSGLAAARALKPALILLDMQLPDLDGLQIFERLRADPLTAAIPCVALSANAMPSDIEQALSRGFSDYWTKPLDYRAFMSSIEVIFGPAPAAEGEGA